MRYDPVSFNYSFAVITVANLYFDLALKHSFVLFTSKPLESPKTYFKIHFPFDINTLLFIAQNMITWTSFTVTVANCFCTGSFYLCSYLIN